MKTNFSLKSLFFQTILFIGIAMLTASPGWAAFTLMAEANPDPAEPSQMMDVQVSVSTTSATGTLTLRMLWPEELNGFPFFNGGGTCPGSCQAGEYMVWNLSALEADTSVTVGFNTQVLGNVADDTFIPLEFELLEDAVERETLSLSVEVQVNSPLELVIDPMTDPVVSEGTLVYEINFGNSGSASSEDTELIFPVPEGTQFLSTTGGGVFSAGSVSWDLGTLRPGGGGRERVSVQVDTLSAGSLLLVNAASLSGNISFLPKQSRAMAVSRVGPEELELALEINPDPAEPGQILDSQITVGNPTASATGALTLRVLWPQELSAFPFITDGGGCAGSCGAGEYSVWDLGIMAPGGSRTVSFNTLVLGNIADGTLIPLEVELFEAGLGVRTKSHTVITRADSPLEVTIDPLSDPVASEETLVYEISYGNSGVANTDNTQLSFRLPAGTQFLSATSDGVLSGATVRWNIGSLGPGGGGRERVSVQLDALNDGRLLQVDAARLSAVISFLPRASQAMAVSRVGPRGIALGVEINPDPVEPGQLVDSQIVISNPTGSVTGALGLRFLWPEELNAFPVVTGGGGCAGSCSPGEYMVWELGVLGPGAGLSVGFNTTMHGNTVDGTLVPLEIELFEGGQPARNNSHTLIARTDSPLELTVVPLPDPVKSEGTLVYDIIYANSGNVAAENSSLNFPVPEGTQFVSATGGGMFSGDSVNWNLGTLAPNGGGLLHVTVQVDALSDGSLLLVNAARLSGEVSFLPKEALAMAVGRVAPGGLELELEVTPNPVEPGQTLETRITVTNPNAGTSGGLILRVLWPEGLNAFPVISGAGRCPGSCGAGEYLTWDLGVLGSSADVVVGFSTTVLGNNVDGTLIPLEVELFEGGFPERNTSQTILVNIFNDWDGDGIPDVFDDDDDNDGMSDWCEIRYGLNPFDPSDADDDPDGDGLTNLEECLAGTDPHVNNDLLFKDGFESLED
jgi:uncharacterized repeat protein (TIGR01451 family)